ncbi:LysM peptidoglycan-binding domain-containing protein [Geobacter sp. SVR]|uniref:LysM peptidoglycan-binding domain-containing protein n=1 Tax=Geobacter sp. SVR TaxID=2495594 RepID=UPI00143EF5B8|nr:LysM peptidoglycan-binding domain-containing protein [Geobacter sp. SVR]BCS55257.1 hypothetical protein GSVR_35650 [Geobacter sp. SVR]GCF86056.1 hypothetical protein GSbR_26560 [Geobacter sp. SVR]
MKIIVPVAAILGLALCGAALGSPSEFDINPKDLPPSRASEFELDLKELPPARPGKPSQPPRIQHRKHRTEHRESASGEIVRYTVRPGDHLYLILVRHFGLSDEAAERLIPQAMQLNGIHNPRALQVGQELKIPLTARASKHAGKGSAKPAAADRHAATAAATAQDSLPVSIAAAPSCVMARKMTEGLGLLAPQPGIMQGILGFTASNAGLSVVVACELPASEAYTYERLLMPYNTQLLVFREDESPRRIIEKLANRLGLRYTIEDRNAPESSALSYVFEEVGPERRTVRLTLLPSTDERKVGNKKK